MAVAPNWNLLGCAYVACNLFCLRTIAAQWRDDHSLNKGGRASIFTTITLRVCNISNVDEAWEGLIPCTCSISPISVEKEFVEKPRRF